MVSNYLGVSSQELAGRLLRVREQFADDPEYQALRTAFPDDWPL
jgi:hypothetical protein